MAKGCVTVIKYFLFLFNLIFFVFGALIMGFGLWVLFDNQSFIAVLQESSDTVKVASYILIGVGSLSMAMGFFGCIGAIYEIRCLLGLYFTCLLLILIAQVTAGVLIYFQRDRLKHEMSNIIKGMIVHYTGQNKTTEHTWDYIQRTMKCCGWTGPGNWSDNMLIKNSSQYLYSCSCRNESLPGTDIKVEGLCEHLSSELPIYETRKNMTGDESTSRSQRHCGLPCPPNRLLPAQEKAWNHTEWRGEKNLITGWAWPGVLSS
ncbi:CD82 molecule b isoform X2 [Phycodurus eques]|uniref:CD82 molecule b isoform X2 n=1 Tax=Phycodurus eques TaxID=693459 RepID=UPI002ACD50F2|nr:CD82 molecule b isoform X2 [Phycodurus eques]